MYSCAVALTTCTLHSAPHHHHTHTHNCPVSVSQLKMQWCRSGVCSAAAAGWLHGHASSRAVHTARCVPAAYASVTLHALWTCTCASSPCTRTLYDPKRPRLKIPRSFSQGRASSRTASRSSVGVGYPCSSRLRQVTMQMPASQPVSQRRRQTDRQTEAGWTDRWQDTRADSQGSGK